MVTWGKNKYMLKKNKHTCSPLKTKGVSNQACSAVEYSERDKYTKKKRKPSTSCQSIHMTTLPGWVPSTALVRLEQRSWARRRIAKGTPYKQRYLAAKILDPQTIFVFYSSHWGQSLLDQPPWETPQRSKLHRWASSQASAAFWEAQMGESHGQRSLDTEVHRVAKS